MLRRRCSGALYSKAYENRTVEKQESTDEPALTRWESYRARLLCGKKVLAGLRISRLIALLQNNDKILHQCPYRILAVRPHSLVLLA